MDLNEELENKIQENLFLLTNKKQQKDKTIKLDNVNYQLLPLIDLVSESTPFGIFGFNNEYKKHLFSMDSFVSILGNSISTVMHEFDLENRRKHRNRLSSLSSLAGGIAHDFNNALFTITGATELAQHNNENPKVEHYLNTISEVSNDAKALTNKLLSFSKKGSVKFEHNDMHKIIEDALLMITSGANKEIEVKTKLSAENYTVYGDETELRNMILNLGLNAVQAVSNSTGIICINTKNIFNKATRVDLEGRPLPKYCLEIEIIDNGPGINPEIMNQIFVPFFSSRSKGTGLGLAMVYGTVKEHRGNILVSSTPDKEN